MNKSSDGKGTKEFPQVYDGEWIRPSMTKGYVQECCGCGLRHLIKFRVVKTEKRSHIEIKFNKL